MSWVEIEEGDKTDSHFYVAILGLRVMFSTPIISYWFLPPTIMEVSLWDTGNFQSTKFLRWQEE